MWAQTLVLQITQNIDGCRGGEICDTQPSIVILNQASLQIEYGFSGNVYVQLGSTPTGYESLYIGQDCDLSGCGQKVIGSLASVAFSNGVAEFEVSFQSYTVLLVTLTNYFKQCLCLEFKHQRCGDWLHTAFCCSKK